MAVAPPPDRRESQGGWFDGGDFVELLFDGEAWNLLFGFLRLLGHGLLVPLHAVLQR